MRYIFSCFLFFGLSLPLWSQPDSLSGKMEVTTRITWEEIRHSGARDLTDVLRLVPGFDFAVGEEGRLGTGLRGVWGEGRIRVEIDGQLVNDLFTGGLSLGNHFPVALIREIEIVKGPVSMSEGLFAQQGVIRIHTANGADQSGFSMGYSGGRMEGSANRSNQYIFVGKNGKNAGVNLSIFRGRGQRSAGDIFAWNQPGYLKGSNISLAGNSDLEPAFTQLHFYRGKFRVRYARDYYDITDVTRLDSAGVAAIHPSIQNNLLTFSHELKISPKITLSPRLTGIVQFSRIRGVPAPQIQQARGQYSNLLDFELLAKQITRHGHLQYGLETFAQLSNRVRERPWVKNDMRSFGAWQADLFFESTIHRSGVDFSPGIRLGINSAFGKLLTASLGFHRTVGHWDFRLLGGTYLRMPTAGNFALSYFRNYTFNKDSSQVDIPFKYLRPEDAFLGEASAEWKPYSFWSVRLSIFRNLRRNAIESEFFQDSLIRRTLGPLAGFDTYRNGPEIGTQSGEITIRYRNKTWWFSAGYSFYTPAGSTFSRPNSVRTFDLLPSNRALVSQQEYLAFARHTASVNFCYFPRNDVSVNISGNYIGRRYGYDLVLPSGQPGNPEGILVHSPQTLLVNLYVHYKGWIYRGVDIGGGIYNLLGQEYRYYQPYFGNKSALPGQSREILLTLSIDIGFRSNSPPSPLFGREGDFQRFWLRQPSPVPSLPKRGDSFRRKQG
ncbi:MAG: TonB-dependent receptor plug domain-containing protein [Bacteroidia bacterium]